MKKVLSRHLSFVDYFLSFILVVSILFTYSDLPKTFYQQDEWLAFGQSISRGFSIFHYGFNPVQVLFGENRPLTKLLSLFFFQVVPFNITILAAFSIGFHILNTLTVFLISRVLLEKRGLAFLSALFFAVNSVAHQSVSWFGAGIGLLPAAFLIFTSLLLFLLYLNTNKKKYLFFSLILSVASLYFKENGFFLFALYPILLAVTSFRKVYPQIVKKRDNLRYRKRFNDYMVAMTAHFDKRLMIPYLAFILIYIFYRLFTLMQNNPSHTFLNNASFATNSQQNLFLITLINSVFYPLTSMSLTFIPPNIALSLAKSFATIYYPFSNNQFFDLITQTIVLDLLAVLFSSILLLLLVFIFIRYKRSRFPLIFFIIFFFLSLLPYSIIIKSFSYLEPRYYYISIFSLGIFFSIAVNFILRLGKGIKLLQGIVIALVVILFSIHMLTVRVDIERQVVIADERKDFIARLQIIRPQLSENTNVFYVTGNKGYFTENNYVPFQQGLGYTLMVIYQKSNKIPANFLYDGFLWGMLEEGFKREDTYGFGYFHDLENLQDSIRKNSLPKESIIALYYDGNNKKMINITSDVIKSLEFNHR